MKERPDCPCGGYQETCDGCFGERQVQANVGLIAEQRWIDCPACGGTGLQWFHIDGCPTVRRLN